MDHDPNKTLYLVFSNPVDGMEDEFNEWYDNVHLPEVLATPGLKSAQRFKIRETEMTHNSVMPKPVHRDLIAYEMEGDVEAIMAKVSSAAQSGEMQMSPALDLTNVAMSFWAPHGDQVVKDT